MVGPSIRSRSSSANAASAWSHEGRGWWDVARSGLAEPGQVERSVPDAGPATAGVVER